jgi:hypothetical protein
MKEFLDLIIFMGQVRKDNMKDYWSTSSTICAPVLPHTMSRNHFQAISQAWHLSENSQDTQGSGRFLKLHSLHESVLICINMSFTSSDQVYSPHRELSLHEDVVPGRGRQNIQSQENYRIWTVEENGVGS